MYGLIHIHYLSLKLLVHLVLARGGNSDGVEQMSEDDLSIRTALGKFFPSIGYSPLPWHQNVSPGRCFGALCDRNLAFEDFVLAM
ncbi:hypothetical protein AgCh_023542 [Apium graveolens]